MTVENPVDNLTKPRHCGSVRASKKSGPGNVFEHVVSPGPDPYEGGAMGSIPAHDRRPRTIGDDITELHAGDHAAWLAALLRLPAEHVRARLEERQTDLYRAYDADGRLVYVGITKDFKRRLNEHRKYSHWYARARHFTVSTYPTRDIALSVEAQLHDETPPQFGWCEHSQYRPEHHSATVLAEREVTIPEPVGMSY